MRGFHCLYAYGFRIYFTPLSGVLFAFPSRYWFTIGQSGVFSLGGWSPHIQTRFHVPRPTRHHHISPFVYRTITHYGCTSQSIPLELIWLNGLFPVRSPLLRESQLISFPKGTEMFHFPSFASITYVFSYWYLPYSRWVPPFRHLRINGYLPPPRSFSQAITSFFASDCQGIHHMHLITWLYNPEQSLIPTSRIKTVYDDFSSLPYSLLLCVLKHCTASIQFTYQNAWFS